MAKITATISVSGTDLVAMRDEALEMLGDLDPGPWNVTEVDLWGQQELASSAGTLRSWGGSFTAETTL